MSVNTGSPFGETRNSTHVIVCLRADTLNLKPPVQMSHLVNDHDSYPS